MPRSSGYGWPELLGRLLLRESLPAAATAWAMDEIMAGEATSAQLAAFLMLLRAKGETAAELTGLAATMLERAPAVTVAGRCVDIVGTGGDGAHTVNITTMAALVTAGSGRQVLKHGNRSASSLCGAADVLEKLGVVIELDAVQVARTVAEAGIGFCFAPVFHSGMRHAGPTRRELGVPTAMNVLGPLTNPGRPAAGAIGCADARIAPVLAEVFARRAQNVLVFRGDDGLDEITTTTTTQVWTSEAGIVRQQQFDPRAVGLAVAEPDSLRGGDAEFNAAVVHQVLAGQSGSIRDAVLVNAAAAIAAFDEKAGDVVDQIRYGLPIAAAAVDSGAAAELLQTWVTISSEVAVRA